MLASLARTQARLLLRSRISSIPSLALAHPTPSALAGSRLLSTTSILQWEDRASRPPKPPSKTLWVGNLPYDAEASELKELFSPIGEPVEIRIG